MIKLTPGSRVRSPMIQYGLSSAVHTVFSVIWPEIYVSALELGISIVTKDASNARTNITNQNLATDPFRLTLVIRQYASELFI
jgi:hypothetical protein